MRSCFSDGDSLGWADGHAFLVAELVGDVFPSRRRGAGNLRRADPLACWFDPDPASISGRSVRVLGYAPSAEAVLTVILLPADADPSEQADGDWWGVNAWRASTRDRRIYAKGQS